MGDLESNAMWKAIVAGTAALAIAGTSLVYAQQRGGRDGMMQRQFNAEDLRAFGEARLAALKAGLTLTAEQEKNWPAFEQAARDYGKLRMDRLAAMRSGPASDDPVERLRQRATAMSDAGAALKKLADATDPLYKSLDENQKRRFAILNRLTGPDRGGFRGREGRDGDGFRGREGRDDGMHHWGPRRSDRGMMDMEHSGGQRL
jgi:zinc resistance-associated protein